LVTWSPRRARTSITRPDDKDTTATARDTSGLTTPVTLNSGAASRASAVANGNCSGWSTWTMLVSPSRSTMAGGGAWRTRDGGRIDAIIEVDAHLPPGFSGGPLLATDGRALGMNTSRLVRGGTTIPHATLARVVGEILAHGTVRRPRLGVAVHPVERGVVVLSVQNCSAAESAGIIVGDVVEAINDSPLRDPHSLREILQSLDIGAPSTLRLTRGGEPREVQVTPS